MFKNNAEHRWKVGYLLYELKESGRGKSRDSVTLSLFSGQYLSSSQKSVDYYNYGNHKQYMYQCAYARESKESH
jgi:hypothetical protein